MRRRWRRAMRWMLFCWIGSAARDAFFLKKRSKKLLQISGLGQSARNRRRIG
jgi:hypothetical protein